MKKEVPNYYAIIPASVRYDKGLPAGAKLMYGEITALSNAKGYCFASNGYFAELYGCTPQAISKWIKQLECAGYVAIEYVGDPGNMQRRVSISVDTYQSQLIGLSTTVEGVSMGVEYNNTSNNTTRGNKRAQPRFVPPTLEEIISYLQPEHEENFARREAEKFRDHFESNGWKVGGRAAMKDWKAAARNWMRRAEQYKPKNNGKDKEPRIGATTESTLRRAYASLLNDGF